MKKIVDVGYLRDPKHETFLSRSNKNIVVLSDYACMECYKGNSLQNLRLSLEIISKYPSQVLILKNTRKIVQLKNTAKGLQKRFIDKNQTKGFSFFCKQVAENKFDKNDLDEKHLEASRFFHGMMDGHDNIIDGIKGIKEEFAKENLKILKNNQRLTENMIDKIIKDILKMTALLIRDHPDIDSFPDASNLKTHFIFRYAIAAYALGLKWIVEGGIEQVKKQKLRNDFVDAFYCAYASYYDGLLTRDEKMKDVYAISNAL